jgi:FKBP-type peptidyl-prolyl cis-trans isomerase SlyD
MAPQTVQNGVIVSLDYVLKLDNGEVVDQSPDGDPLVYLHGAQNIIPGLENALTGMAVNESKTVNVKPEDGYGDYDPEGTEVVERAFFGDDVELSPGVVLTLRDVEGNIFDAVVTELDDANVTLDFNHPLAGETLHFAVKVVELRDATPEELDHGHPHVPGMHAH